MEHIKNIEIKNFKSIRHAEIKDCRRVNVFIGEPNVGKSNILEAISLSSYLKKENTFPLNYFCRFKELIDVFSDGYKQNDAEVFVGNYVFSLRYINNNQLDFSVIERNKYVEKYNSVTVDILKNLKVSKDGRVDAVSIKEYHDDDNFVVKIYFFNSNKTQPINIYNQTILSFPFGPNLTEVIRYNGDLRKSCGELLSSYKLKLIFHEDGSMVVQKQLDEYSAFQFSFSQIADTLQRLIFYRAAIASNKNTTLLFEEPEAHMFPPYISKFTSDIVYDKNNNQYFIATHSPFVLNNFMEDMKDDELAIYLVSYKSENGETIVDKMTKEEMHEAYQFGYDFFLNMKNFIPTN